MSFDMHYWRTGSKVGRTIYRLPPGAPLDGKSLTFEHCSCATDDKVPSGTHHPLCGNQAEEAKFTGDKAGDLIGMMDYARDAAEIVRLHNAEVDRIRGTK